jgi:hypothetical protein
MLNLATDTNSLAHYAKGTQSGIALTSHSPPTACKHGVSDSVSLPLTGFFSPFPCGTDTLSVTCLYLALEDGAPRFPQGVSDPMVLGILLEYTHVSLTGLSPSLADFPKSFNYVCAISY